MPFLPPNQQRQSTEGTITDYFEQKVVGVDIRLKLNEHLQTQV